MSSAYDDTPTDVYEALAVPLVFEAPARDLVAAAEIRSGHRVLDVGTGTGVVARIASEIVGARGHVVGVDSSRTMLHTHSAPRLHTRVLGSVPDLPFAQTRFDVVVASFVINHFSDYSAGLAAMTSLLVDGGRMGVSAWCEGERALVDLWDRVASEFTDMESIVAKAEKAIPCGSHFAIAGNLEKALIGTNLTNVEISVSSHRVLCSPEQYVSLRSILRKGRLIRQVLSLNQWDRLLAAAISAFETEYGKQIEYSSKALLAVGTRVC